MVIENVVKKIDLLDIEKLNEQLYIYVGSDNKNPYLFMSFETLDVLTHASNIKYGSKDCTGRLDCGAYALYMGYKIYINNDLAYGEIELR